jgi:hypothetical protein
LAGEPKNSFAVEGRSIEIGFGEFFRKRKKHHGFGCWVESCNRVLSTFGDPGSTIRADNNAMWRGTLAKRNLDRLSGLRI